MCREYICCWQLIQKCSGCEAIADVRAQPVLWLVAADFVVTASWVFVPIFSSISRSSRSQFAFWLLLSRRPILYQRFWWNWQNLHSYYCLSGIFEWNLSSQRHLTFTKMSTILYKKGTELKSESEHHIREIGQCHLKRIHPEEWILYLPFIINEDQTFIFRTLAITRILFLSSNSNK